MSRGTGTQVGDKVKFPMLKNNNGCLFPVSSGEENRNNLECIIVEGEVIEIDGDMLNISYYCPYCKRHFITTIMSDTEQ